MVLTLKSLQQPEENGISGMDKNSNANDHPVLAELSEVLKYAKFFIVSEKSNHIRESINEGVWRCRGFKDVDLEGICRYAQGAPVFFIVIRISSSHLSEFP